MADRTFSSDGFDALIEQILSNKQLADSVGQDLVALAKETRTALNSKQNVGEAVRFFIPGDETQWDPIVNYKYRLSVFGQLLDSNNEKLILTDDQGQEYTIMYEEGEFYKATPNGDFLEDENGLIVLSGFELFKYCDVPVQGLVANDRVDVTIDPASMDAAVICGLRPITESLDGIFRLFADDIPSGDIAAQYWITRGKGK